MTQGLICKIIPNFILSISVSLCACTSNPPALTTFSNTIFHNNNNSIPLTAAQISLSRSGPLYIFIEGDGHAYLDRHTPSPSPTPVNPVALQLARQTATQLPNAAILYIARPCMWPAPHATCRDKTLWTEHRFNADILTAQTTYIEALLKTFRTTQTPVTLIGYSGGAAIALNAATALRGHHISTQVITIAGNLDPTTTNMFHKVTKQPAWGATPYASLTTLPQHHLVGTSDKIIPPELTEIYLQKLGSKCADVTLVEGATHAKGWATAFAQALTQPFTCTP